MKKPSVKDGFFYHGRRCIFGNESLYLHTLITVMNRLALFKKGFLSDNVIKGRGRLHQEQGTLVGGEQRARALSQKVHTGYHTGWGRVYGTDRQRCCHCKKERAGELESKDGYVVDDFSVNVRLFRP
jgi:hypothetical protein